MCGLTGFVLHSGGGAEGAAISEALETSLDRILHRGPDDRQVAGDREFGLGFCRLAIIDPENGRQPFETEDGGVLAATNGEIFNHQELRAGLCARHRLDTVCDCEVIPHLYEERGVDVFSELDGIFATAILDRSRRRLILGRDRLGVRPLFFSAGPTWFVFASEMKALWAYPPVSRTFDWQAAVQMRHRLFLPLRNRVPETQFKGISMLPAGCYLELDLEDGSFRVERWWDPREAGPAYASADQAVEGYRAALTEAVDRQLMADVPIGVFLSGGIDSVTVAALAARRTEVQAFSVLSQSTMGNGDAAHAAEAGRALGIDTHMVRFDWRESGLTPAVWKSILWHLETPAANAEHLYKFMLHRYARAVVPGLKVMLLGSGSDEFNGGYAETFHNPAVPPSWEAFVTAMGALGRASAVEFGLGHNEYMALAGGQPIFTPDFLVSLSDARCETRPIEVYRDIYLHALQIYHLWHEDRTAAANGIEARVPFLDHRLVETSFRIPEAAHRELLWNKEILRRAVSGLVPEPVARRPKVPFYTGEDERYTRRMVLELLCADGMALVEEACAPQNGLSVLDIDGVRAALASAVEDPTFAKVDRVFEIVNMALLSRMAMAPPELPEVPVLERVDVGASWADFAEDALVEMVARAPTLSDHSVIAFATGVRLVECVGGDPDYADEGAVFLLVGSDLRFELDEERPEWLRFLKSVDGERRVSEVLAALDLPRHSIWKDLEEALEFEILHVLRDEQGKP